MRCAAAILRKCYVVAPNLLMLCADDQADQIIGAHLFGPEYAELVNIFAWGIRLGLKTADLKKMVSAYPSLGSDFGSLA